jgi:hypothetical protein
MWETHSSPWSRRIWWVPGVLTAVACVLAAAALRPPEAESALLALAILCALPWSLALLLLALVPGFAGLAGMVVAFGLVLNIAGAWWITAVVRAHWFAEDDAAS